MGSYESGKFSLGYVDPTDSGSVNLKAMKDHFYLSSYPQNSSYWVQGAIDKRFKVGDQSLYSMIYGDNNYHKARRFFFNLIMRHIKMIGGYQRKNRKSTITIPINDTDQLADDFNKVLKWSEDRDGFQEYFSQSFENCLDVGSNLLHLYPDYTLDPISGDLFTDSVSYNNYLIDPYYRKMDFSDCGFIWRRRWVTKLAAKALLPGRSKEIDKMRSGGIKDGRFPLQAELLNVATNQLFAMDEVHYRSTREATIILDPKSGESVEWEENEEEQDDMMEQVLKQQPWLITKKVQVPTVKLIIQVGDHILYHGANLLNIDPYPFVPHHCYYDSDIQSMAWRCFGVVRNLRDAQYLYNMRKVIELDLLQSQVQNAWIYPVDAVVDPKAFRQTQNGCLIPLKAGRLPSEIQRLEPQGIPPSVIELSRSLSEDITKISGVNEELLGSATDDKAGILSMLRQSAGIVTLQGILDKSDFTQRLYGKIRLQAIRKNFSRGKIASILGREPDPRFFTSHSLKYSVAVEEGNYSTSQRQMELQQLLHFREIGIPIANKSIVRAAFITNKKQVEADMMEEQQQQAQQAQAQAEQMAKKDQAAIMTQYSKSRVDLAREKDLMASAEERLSKMNDLQAKAEHERTESELNLVKMMIELETLDMNTFKNAWDMAQAIRTANELTEAKKAQTLGV